MMQQAQTVSAFSPSSKALGNPVKDFEEREPPLRGFLELLLIRFRQHLAEERCPEINGMAEAFVRPFKRDMSRLPRSRMLLPLLLALIDSWMEDYNTIHPHPGWATAHPGSTSFPSPLRLRFNGVNSRLDCRPMPASRTFLADTRDKYRLLISGLRSETELAIGALAGL